MEILLDNCVILAGGKSKRFDSDKALLFGEYQFNQMSKFFRNVFFSVKDKKFNFTNNYIFDENKEYAPIFALKSILERFDEVFIFSVDSFF